VESGGAWEEEKNVYEKKTAIPKRKLGDEFGVEREQGGKSYESGELKTGEHSHRTSRSDLRLRIF